MRQNTIGTKQVSELITKAAVLARGSGTFVSRGWTRVILPAVLAAASSSTLAGPEGASVVRGDVNITKVGNQTVIQASDRAIINYRSFDIGSTEAVRFIQPSSQSRVLNRIDGAAPTRIEGSLMANGRVYIVNPAGVMFGAGARVDVAGLYAAGGHLSDTNFINGVDRFTDVRGAVENHGTIQTQAAALIGSRVANTGQIVAPQGTVVMASGNDVLIGEQGGNIYVRVSGEAGGGDTKRAATENTGTITADRGQVVLGAGDMLGLAISNAGSIKAKNVTVQGQGTGTVMVAGTIDVSNQADSKAGTGDRGGRVEIAGQNVGLDNATINASGTHAGGTVLIGGDEHGEGDVAHAEKLIMNTGSRISADATDLGQGGKVVLWSDQWTAFGGEISARGGSVAGDGGFIETSSKNMLTIEGARVNASASRNSRAGLWLLDPTDVTLSTLATASMGGTPSFSPTGNPSAGNVQISAIVTALQGGSNVSVVTTSVSGAGPEGGSIRVNNAVAIDLEAGGGVGVDRVVSLTLTADSFIVVDGAISATGTAGDTFSLNLSSGATVGAANKSITVNQAISTLNNGAITLNAGGATGGLITLNANLNSGTGAINLTGAGVTQSSGGITAGTLTLTGTGTFTVNSGTNAFSTLAGTMTGATTIATTSALTLTGTIASGGGNIAFTAGGVNQTGGSIGGGPLFLAGPTAGAFNFSSITNAVTSVVVAGVGSVNGALTLVNNSGLVVNLLKSLNNPIDITARTGTLTVSGDIQSGTSSVVLTADTMTLDAGVNIGGDVGAPSTGSTVTLRPFSAARDVFLGDAGTGLSLSAADLVKVRAGALVIGNTNSTATTTVSQAAGGLNLSSKSYTLTINSGSITSNQLTTAAAVTYNLGVTGAAGTLNLDQAITTGGAAITINGGTAGDTFNLVATQTGNAISVNGAGGVDTFNVGGASNSVAILLANVAINGGGNADILNYNDSAQTGATYTVNTSGIRRASGAFASFTNMGAGTVTLNAGNSGSTGANEIDIANLATGPSFVANGGGGDDTFRIGGTADTNGNLTNIAASITVNGGGGTNDIRVDDGASGTSRTYSIGGATTSFGTGVSISHGSNIQTYSLFASGAGNSINVTDTISARTFFRINGGAGNDAITVGSVGNDLAGFLGGLDVQAGTGTNSLTVNDQGNLVGGFGYTVTRSSAGGSITRTGVSTITFDNNMGAVVLNGAGVGANTLAFADSDGSNNTYTFANGSITRGSTLTYTDTTRGSALTYTNINSITASLGSGDNRVFIESANRALAITGGVGGSGFFVDSNSTTAGGTVDNITALVTITGGGTNTLTLNDRDDIGSTADTVSLSGTSIGAGGGDSFFGAGGSITFSNLASITIFAGSNLTIANGATLGANTLIDTKASTNRNFSAGSIDGAFALTVDAGTANAAFGVLGGSTPLTGFSTTSALNILNGNITTASGGGGITLVGATRLDASVTLTSNDTGITTGNVNALAAGTQGLTLVAGTGDIVLGNLGATTRLGAFQVTSVNDLTAGSITATRITQLAGAGTSTFASALNTSTAQGIQLTGSIFVITGGADTRTAGTGDGIFSLTSTGGAVISTADLDLGGTFTKAGAGDLSLGSNITTANGSILVNGGNVTLTAASTMSTNGGTNSITFAGGVALAGNNLTLVSDNTVSRFNGGANSVTGTGAGVLTIRPSTTSASIGVAGGAGTVAITTTDLDALANNAAARIDIGTASTGTHNITVGASTFRDPVRFLAPGVGGQVNFTGNVTGLTNASITAIGPAAIGLSADIVTAGSAITLTGPVTVTGNRLLDTTAGGTVTAGADIAVSGATEGSALNNDSLTMQAGTTGGVSTSTIGLATSLLNLTIGSSATANTGSITAQGIAVTSNSGTHNLLSAGSDGISLTGGSFTLNAGADTSAGGTMQVQNTGLLTIVGPINLDGFFRQGTALGIPGGTSLNGNVTTTGDEITFAGPVTLLGATRTFTSAGGNVTFSGLVTGPSQMVISAGAGDVRLAGATTVDGGFSSTGAGFDNSGALITTVDQNVTVNHTGAITLGSGVNAGSGLVSLTGSQITQNGAIISGGYTASAGGNIAINAFIRGNAGGIDVHSGTSGTGNISFGGGTIDLFADTISLRAGDGAAGAGTTSQVLANGAGVIFHGTSSGNSPVNLTLRSDGNIDDTTTPAAGQYANTPAGVNLTLISDDGSVTITDGARVAGTNLALTGATGITLGGSVAPNTLTLNSATTASGDIITNGDLTISSTLGLVGGSHELRSDTGVIFINAAVSAGSSNLTLSAREIQVNAAVNGTGALVIQPVAPGANILLASTALNGAAIADAVLDLSAAEIANFSNGFSSITIGRSNGSGAISTAGALTFLDPVTLRSPTGTIAINDALTGLDNASFSMVAASHTLAANITTNGNAVSFDNALVLNNSVAIDTTNAGAVAGGANVAFGGTVNGDATANERSLTVNAGTAGIISTGGSIGSAAGTLLHNLTLTASSNTIGGGVATSGFQSVTGATTVSGDITTDTSGATGGALASILYANALSITTDTTIRSQGAGLTDTIQLLGGIASVGAKHAITVNSGTSTTTTCGTIDGSNVQFLSPLVLCNDTTVNATVAAVFNSTIDSQVGPFFLTVNSPATTFGGNIGTGTNGILSALTTDAGGTLTINAGIINTTGQQTFNDAATLGSALVATSTTQGVSFLNGVNAQSNAITVNGPGTGAFVGGIANASTVTTDAGGSTQISGSVAATGAVAFGDRLLLTGDTTVNGSSINIFGADSNTATPNALAATTAGAFTLGNSGQTNALTSTNVTAATITLASVQTTTSQSYTGATSTNGTLRSTTSGPIQINGALTLSGDTTIRTAGAASSDDISISGTVQSPGTAFNLTLTSGAGDVLLASDVGGGGNALASLTAQGNTLTLRNVTTTGNQVFTGETGLTGNLFSTGTGSIAVGGNLTLGSDSTISTNNGSVVFGRTVNSDSVARNLTVNTGGSGLTRFVGAVGNNNRLQTLTTNGDGTARFEGSQVRTIGAQSYSDAVTLGNNVLFEGTNLTFGSTVDSDGLATARTLTANTSGSSVTTFVGAVGSTAALSSITTNADGSTVFQNGANTTGSMTFNDAASLTGSFVAGGIAFFANSSTISGSMSATGGMTFTGASNLSGTYTTNGAVLFGSTSSVTGSMTASGGMTFAGAANLAGTVSSGGALSFSNTAKLSGNVTSTGDMTFTGAVTIAGDTTVDSKNSTQFFRSTIDTDASATDPLLTLKSEAVASADVTPFKFNGEIGVTKRLGGLVLGPDLSDTPLAATIGFNKGGYNAAGQMVASSTDITNLLRIVTGPQGFRMGTRQKLTAFGQLSIQSTGTVTLGDLTGLTSIDVQALFINIRRRPAGSIIDKTSKPGEALSLDPQGDGGVDFVARDTITFSQVPEVLGAGGERPTFATNKGQPTANLTSFIHRSFTDGVALRLFVDSTGSTNTLFARDLKSQGPSSKDFATALAGAIPRDTETHEATTPVAVSQAVRELLKEFGIEVKDLGIEEMVRFLVGRSIYQDQPAKSNPNPDAGDYKVSINRLSQRNADGVLEAYNFLTLGKATKEPADVVDTDEIAKNIGEAWNRFEQTSTEPTGAEFRQWLEQLGEKATDQDREVLKKLNYARNVFQRLEYLGLTTFEAAIVKNRLLVIITPQGITSRQMEDAVLGTAPVASNP